MFLKPYTIPQGILPIMSEIFKVQKNSRRLLLFILGYCCLFLVIYAVYSLFERKSFLKYSKETYYIPVREKGLGFTGRVDELLQEALADTDTKQPFNIHRLNSFYHRLRFYYPHDTATYTANVADIRLAGFIPANKDEEAFFKNSYFSQTLQRQLKFLNRNFSDTDGPCPELSHYVYCGRPRAVQNTFARN